MGLIMAYRALKISDASFSKWDGMLATAMDRAGFQLEDTGRGIVKATSPNHEVTLLPSHIPSKRVLEAISKKAGLAMV